MAARAAAVAGKQAWNKILMCRPTQFDVIHEGHNAYMTLDVPVDRDLAMKQWEGVKSTFESLGTKVNTVKSLTQVYDSRPHGFALEGCGDFAYNFDLKHAYLAYGFRFVLPSILH